MIIYQDIFSGDEMISESYPLKEVDGVVFEVDCSLIDSNGGPNDDAEEGQKVYDVIHTFGLEQTSFDKASYMSSIKRYIRGISDKLRDEGKDHEYIHNFQESTKTYLKTKILPNFESWEFYTGGRMNQDAMIALFGYREDGTTPYMIFWKEGLYGMRIS